MKKAGFFIIMLAAGAAIGYFGASYIGDLKGSFGLSTLEKVGLFLFLIPAYLLVIGWHELGHVVFGHWQNFSFKRYILGPFLWSADKDGRLKFGWNKSFNLGGGAALMMPQTEDRLATRFRWFAAGGPIASIVLAVLCFVLPQVLALGGFTYLLFMILCLFSALIAIVTLIPSRVGGLASDGLRILNLGRNTPTAQADLLLLRAMVMMETGENTQGLPREDLQRLAVDSSIPEAMRAAMGYFAYAQLVREDQIEQAAEQLEEVMALVPNMMAGIQDSYYLEQTLFLALYRKDLGAAEQAHRQLKKGPFADAIDLRLAEAALEELRGNREQALHLIEDLEALRPQSIMKGSWALQEQRRAMIRQGL
ncbi:MAG: site-2 protease family protein [Bacteroidota bacterium]